MGAGEPTVIEMLARAGVELVTMEVTAIRKVLFDEPLKFGIEYMPSALSFATRLDNANPVPGTRVVTRT